LEHFAEVHPLAIPKRIDVSSTMGRGRIQKGTLFPRRAPVGALLTAVNEAVFALLFPKASIHLEIHARGSPRDPRIDVDVARA
ncbi:MAG: hypothetical protein ACO3JL_20275, partial [Myxococcota bacterium]